MPVSSITFATSDGLRLEGRIAKPPSPRGAVILCHPHPQFEGSMSSALIPGLQRALETAGLLALRFNFRGVGKSEGSYDAGRGEVTDALAALDRVRAEAPGLPVSIAGWSFGALVGLSAAVTASAIEAFVAIAPPVSWSASGDLPQMPTSEQIAGWPGRMLGICGTEDPFCKPARLRAWMASMSPRAETRIIEGEDHFFTKGRDVLTGTVVAFLSEGLPA